MRLRRDPVRRRRLLALSAVAVAAGVVGVAIGAGDDGAPSSREATAPSSTRAPRLPLPQAVGQVLVMAFDGTAAPEYVQRRLRLGQGAGVILFGGNVADARQLRALT